MNEPRAIRTAILAAPLESSHFGGPPQPGTLYIPPSHLKALKREAHLVIGGRGVGKSFWTAALNNPTLRNSLPDLANCSVSIGFAENPDIARYPNADVISNLLKDGVDPYDMWRAVILRWATRLTQSDIPASDWRNTINFLREQPEKVALLMQAAAASGDGMILFDALDRTSNDWQRMDQIVRGLMRAVLWLKPFARLGAKVFLREDQAERTVFDFPDASKLQATKAELTWARHDLHGMLWQRLINAPEPYGDVLRALCQCRKDGANWRLDEDMKRDSDIQRSAFAALAGPWMGRDRRRGVPYVWSVGHLADGRGYTSPRSFSAAIHQAAEDSQDRYPDHTHALHYESIKRGIQKASEIRVNEIAEDYPWIREVLGVFDGLNVPCSFEDIIRTRWQDRFPNGPSSIPSERLPAQHTLRGWEGICTDLQRLGLVEIMSDGRFNMPDLYRVGFGLGRRGGVRPRRGTAHD